MRDTVHITLPDLIGEGHIVNRIIDQVLRRADYNVDRAQHADVLLSQNVSKLFLTEKDRNLLNSSGTVHCAPQGGYKHPQQEALAIELTDIDVYVKL